MSNNNHKRSSTPRISATPTRSPGVGGRHAYTPPAPGGGGYQDVCTESVFFEKNFPKSKDPRIDELIEIGLGGKWLQIAQTIGFDAFMEVWSILDSDHADDRVRMWVPRFKRYLRYQRNKYITNRAADNDSRPADIKKEVAKLLGESLSLAHIKRIMEKGNI